MRNLFLLAWVLGVSCASWGQAGQSSWANLSTLYTGQKIQIVEKDSTKHSGTFMTFNETAILYQDAAGEQTIPKEAVRRVKLMQNRHRLRNTLIGAAVGVGAGAGIGAASYHKTPCASTDFICLNGIGGRGVPAAIGASLGLVAGAVVGVLLPSHPTIYSVNSH
jgi:hypothetical protein